MLLAFLMRGGAKRFQMYNRDASFGFLCSNHNSRRSGIFWKIAYSEVSLKNAS